jgi:hypothetical protein
VPLLEPRLAHVPALWEIAAVERWKPTQHAREALMSARNFAEAESAYRALFAEAGPEGLQTLTHDPNYSIAVQTAWQRLRDGYPTDFRERPQRFLGLLEGRTRLEIPTGWERRLTRFSVDGIPIPVTLSFRTVVVGDVSTRLCWIPGEMSPFVEAEDDKMASTVGLRRLLVIPDDTSMEARNDQVVLTVNGKSAAVPEAAFSRLLHEIYFHRCVFAIGSGRIFMAFFDEDGGRFPLFCIDSQSGDLCWKADVWSDGCENHSFKCGPPPQHDVWMAVNDRAVGVFGDTGICYAEVFDSRSGANVLRFRASLGLGP